MITRSLLCLSFFLILFSSTCHVSFGDDSKEQERLIEMAIDHYTNRRLDKAIESIDKAVGLNPKNPLAYSIRGTIRFSRKEYDLAIADLNEAIRLEPDQPSSGYYIRGAAWYMKKDYAKAIEDLDKALELDPECIDALNSRAWAAATCPDSKYRDQDKSLRYAKLACDLDGWKNAFLLGTMAAAFAENGKFDEAIKWQKKSLESEAYRKEYGKKGQEMLECFENRKPYRENQSQ